MEKLQHASVPPRARPALGWLSHKRQVVTLSSVILVALWLVCSPVGQNLLPFRRTTGGSVFDEVQRCAIDNLHRDLSFLDQAKPIEAQEFISRRDRLAQALASSKVDAFVLEPGYTFQYYGNISQKDWEPWEPEERPFLMLVLPETSESGTIRARTAFLSPHFEEGRARMLGIPSRDAELDIVTWEEHWNPYTTLLESQLFADFKRTPKLMMDEEIRDYIVRGLDAAGFETVGLNPAVELVRQIKSAAEVELLRAVNTGTVEAVRAMRPCLVPGLTENQVTDILDNAMLSIGFQLFFNIVLFEEHGALPHGGFVTGGLKLRPDSMILIDAGYKYLGYASDICRSFFMDPPTKRLSLHGRILEGLRRIVGLQREQDKDWSPRGSKLHEEKLRVWDIVLEAQTAAAAAFQPNATAASVDIAARTVIDDAGYGYGFTHRLGHGIGIKAHESPYLNKWNTGIRLQAGMTFTNEPGIYLENRFGVRHEDIYLVTESGEAELLSGRRARGPYDP
ncbi:hypothetical protein diail_789 [Diaporthe ilicicola]|nr:hypothetical protein diail_789 [Diaporthe ilicicola]